MNNLDFLNLNMLRKYPIKDGASCVSTDGLFTLPDDLIADMIVSAPSSEMMRLHISKVINTSSAVHLEISSSESEVLGTFVIGLGSYPEHRDIGMSPASQFPSLTGRMTVGGTKGISKMPSGEFHFELEATELLMRVFTPASTGLSYITFADDAGGLTKLTGAITINAESNLRFNVTNQVVNIDAGNGLGLNVPCDEDLVVPIRMINGVKPDELGNFTLMTSECISLTEIENGLLLSDTCGKPCMGCDELGVLTDRTMTVESELIKVRDYVSRLDSLVNQLTTLINYQCEC